MPHPQTHTPEATLRLPSPFEQSSHIKDLPNQSREPHGDAGWAVGKEFDLQPLNGEERTDKSIKVPCTWEWEEPGFPLLGSQAPMVLPCDFRKMT